jgi:hypothetical protein
MTATCGVDEIAESHPLWYTIRSVGRPEKEKGRDNVSRTNL